MPNEKKKYQFFLNITVTDIPHNVVTQFFKNIFEKKKKLKFKKNDFKLKKNYHDRYPPQHSSTARRSPSY